VSSIKLPPPVRDRLEVETPIPPSVNNLFRSTGNKRFKTREYRDWLALAVPAFSRLRQAAAFPVEVWVCVVGKVNQARDLDNLLKPIGDALVDAGVLPGDNLKHVNRWDVWFEPSDGEPRVLVSFWQPGDPPAPM
jgi:Holliday junction resolvase RusA-like endonuclease